VSAAPGPRPDEAAARDRGAAAASAAARDPAPPASARTKDLPLARRFAHDGDAFDLSLRRFQRMWSSPGTLGGAGRMPMVRWFDPLQLLRTGLETLTSTIVGRRSDARVTMALADAERRAYDCAHWPQTGDAVATDGPGEPVPRDELWIDYVCDTGDGWNPTYAIAWAVAQPELEVAGVDGAPALRTPRADVLVFGGDQVYPSPTRPEYERRLVAPYTQAFGQPGPDDAAPPRLFAIPGNHDWYDGLSAFTRLFCTDVGGRWLGGWRTEQTRSYFALRLPGHWWLVGVDSQLHADLDPPQIEYFRAVAEREMRAGDRVILCLSEPTWVYAHKYRQYGGTLDETDLLYLRDEVFAPRGIEVRVFLAGDLHHYRRHEELRADGGVPIQKITAGGGGAFLHPTHDEDVARIVEQPATPGTEPREYALRAAYPSTRDSRRLTWGNLFFAAKNPTFGIVTALLYAVTAWMFGAAVHYPDAPTEGSLDAVLTALEATGRAFLNAPGLTLWVVVMALVFMALIDTRSKLYRIVGGLSHAAAHGVALFALAWGAAAAAHAFGPAPKLATFMIAGVLVFAGGWLIGSVVTGLYLLVSLNVFGRHSQEAFSSLRIEDYKHFLRMCVRRDGSLTIYPIRVHRVPRKWRERRDGDASRSRVQPAEPIVPELIERPIELRPA
jgi:hypothetical protein